MLFQNALVSMAFSGPHAVLTIASWYAVASIRLMNVDGIGAAGGKGGDAATRTFAVSKIAMILKIMPSLFFPWKNIYA